MTWIVDRFSAILSFLTSPAATPVPVNQRVRVRFIGGGVSGQDNPGLGCTDVTIPGCNVPGAPLAGSSLSLGAQVPPQFSQTVGTTSTISTGTQLVVSVPGPNLNAPVVAFDTYLTGHISLAVPGCLLPVRLVTSFAYASFGTSGPLGFIAATDQSRSSVPPVMTGAITPSISSGNVLLTVAALVIPAWAAGAYTGVLMGTLPNAIVVQASLVTHGGNLYVCTAGGTATSGNAPTGTGSSPITGSDGVTWYYVSAASAPLTLSYTLSSVVTEAG